ncbi:heterokaryon incompatibility protein-domain-containing protein [Xylariaceae sp. FL1651]|nr:heterokaryon incompatibility protein-domain-containing protein [Xylariaceae sp. FL1651]
MFFRTWRRRREWQKEMSDWPKRSYTSDPDECSPQDHPRQSGYPYHQLVDTDIRLLKIVPGAVEDKIECVLDQVPLNAKPKFYALSYVWGDTLATKQIMINGKPFAVTNNLYEALHHFRQLSHLGYLNHYFWIDAICINQDDLDERSREVLRMNDIYHLCFQVIIWLGPNGPPSSNTLKRLARDVTSFRDWKPPSKMPEQLDWAPRGLSPDDAVEELFDKAYSMMYALSDDGEDDALRLQWLFGRSYVRLLRALKELLSRPWFRRTWTLQEACFHANPLVFAGLHAIGLEYLLAFFRVLRGEHRHLLASQGARRLFVLERIRMMRQAILNPQSEDCPWKKEPAEVLTLMLQLTPGKLCTDPRDHLYGLVGLIEFLGHDLPRDLWPNYHLTYENVCWQYAIFILETTQDLRLLDCSRHDLQEVPSWVPDFRYVRLGKQSRPESVALICSDSRTLQLQGFVMSYVCDQVEKCEEKVIRPNLQAIPIELSERINTIEERIFKPAQKMRGINRELALHESLKNATRIFHEGGLGAAYDTFHRLHKSPGKRDWLSKRRMTMDSYGKEIVLSTEFSRSHVLLQDGTILRPRDETVEIKTGDLACIFKGAPYPHLLRPTKTSKEYTLLCACEIKSGVLDGQLENDDFWNDKEVIDFALV